MVEPSKRTRSTKKVKVRTPGGKTTTHYRGEKTKDATCGRCQKPLSGVATDTATKMKSMAKSSKVPARPYAGILCPQCLDTLIRYVTRFEVKYTFDKFKDLEIERDLTLEKYLPRSWYDNVIVGKITRKTAKTKPTKKPKTKAAPKAEVKHKTKKTTKKKAK